ncbi:hypothetical protein MKW94_005356 [Papaver nudicaule]|uniref:Uncharacterized protein n=1 Tax=Papaver nudicaule TaxID=74823 RepID=A0AA41V9W0_PAPNU|nr:hypothetical protein [Papaver nudicaule]
MDKQNNYHFVFSVLVLFFLCNSAFAINSAFSSINQVGGLNQRPRSRHVSKLFVFGDSYVDTGNNKFTVQSWKVPYGMTFPGFPTSRHSDGLVFTDFFASFMGVRSPMPYTQWNNLNKRRVRNGMNFAHGGTGVFTTWNSEPNMTTQINTFRQYVADGVYNNHDLDRSMALVALSGNDYTQYLLDGGTEEGFQAYIEKVLAQLELNLREIGMTGIKKVVVLTLQPIGCLPRNAEYLSFEKCDKPLNNETIFHNTLHQQIVQRLNSETADSPFDILDLYNAFLTVINKQGEGYFSGNTKAASFEFGKPLLKPCCDPTSAEFICSSVDDNGVKQYTLCENPNDSLFWDGVYPTESGWDAIFSALRPSLDKLFSQLNIHPQHRPSLSGSVAVS